MRSLSYNKVDITGGFWQQKQDLLRKTTIWSVYKRFLETGRFAAFKLDWKEGMPNQPHIFWDSDIAKWLESVAYLTAKKREPKLEAIVDEIVDDIERGQMEDGYFNTHFQTCEIENRFMKRHAHELYCAGHLIEAAIAYAQATGKTKFLTLMEKYVALIRRAFADEGWTKFKTPGHEEIELALVKLYDYTGNREYMDLAAFFINNRGLEIHKVPDMDGYIGDIGIQDHLPVREQFTAEGHAVRACYLYAAMADIALRENDAELKKAVDKLYQNITERKMYITGCVGSTNKGEAFEDDYRLPNDTAYAETCAGIALVFFAQRMSLTEINSHYADTIERIIYNGFLSGLSLDGDAFYYSNPQEIDLEQRRITRASLHDNRNKFFPLPQRSKVFGCSCCPPNITRFIGAIGGYIYNYDDKTIYVNQYMNSTAQFDNNTITQETNYPYEGKIKISVSGSERTIALRIPEWCKAWTVMKNGSYIVDCEVKNGYALVSTADNDTITLDLQIAVRYVKSNPRLMTNRGMTAVSYGPFIMCLEGIDNGGSLTNVKLTGQNAVLCFDKELNLPCLYHNAVRENVEGLYSDKVSVEPFTAKLIPYFAIQNRGDTDMRIWVEHTS